MKTKRPKLVCIQCNMTACFEEDNGLCKECRKGIPGAHQATQRFLTDYQMGDHALRKVSHLTIHGGRTPDAKNNS